jgi:anti-sigma factor RsiW
MNCEDISSLTHAYSDGELDLVRTLELEKHLADCPACSQAYENVKSLKTVLQSTDLYYNAPPRLRRQIRASVMGENRSTRRNPFGWWLSPRLGISAATVAIVALLVVLLAGRESADDRLAQEVTASHVRSLMVAHLTDIASSDQHTVKPWFQGKLDFTPQVIDLAERGFPLVGGRLDYLQGRPVAALVYQRHQHLINLFIWPTSASSASSEKTTVRQGYNLIHWTASGMAFWAASDLNRAELNEFVQLLK